MKIKILLGLMLVLGGIFLWSAGPVMRIIGWDTDQTHYIEIIWNENESSSDRALNVKVNSGSRTLDLSGDFTVEATSKINSDLTTDANWSTSGSMTLGSIIGPAAALDINTSVIQDVNFWDTIASGNPSINIYGWNTAGGDRESAELTMDDTNDEFLIQVPNSANNEGVSIVLQETNQKFRLRQNSDAIQFYHDGTDAYIHTTDGQIILDTDEAAANAMIGLTDSDGSNKVYISAPALGADWTLTLPTAVGATGNVFYTTGDTGVAAWSTTLLSQTGGAEVVGTQVAIGTGAKIDFNDGTDESFIRTVVEPGLSNHYLGIGLDEANRILAIGDAGDIGTTDLGLSAESAPAVYIFNAAGTGSLEINSGGLYGSGQIILSTNSDVTLNTTGSDKSYRFRSNAGSLYGELMLRPATSLADEASTSLENCGTNIFGWVVIGDAEEYAIFIVDGDGDVTILNGSANVVANADTDAKFCLGTAAAQEPLTIKNRLGATKVINLWFFFDG